MEERTRSSSTAGNDGPDSGTGRRAVGAGMTLTTDLSLFSVLTFKVLKLLLDILLLNIHY